MFFPNNELRFTAKSWSNWSNVAALVDKRNLVTLNTSEIVASINAGYGAAPCEVILITSHLVK
jgi:hypothetical protein